MGDFASRLCPKESWHAADRTYCISDPGSCGPACSHETDNASDGMAFVSSDIESRFQPLDHCTAYTMLFHPGRRCDGALVTKTMKTLAFVELKERRHDWFADAAEQLETTIGLFNGFDPGLMANVRVRRAYIANRKARLQPHMSPSMASRMAEFKSETGFRLLVSTQIELHETDAPSSLPTTGGAQ